MRAKLEPAAFIMSHPPDPTCCPLCGQPNRCALELERASGTPQPPCWCTALEFAPALLAQIPTEARNRACICHACASRATPP